MTTRGETPLFFEHAGKRLYGVFYPAKRAVTPRRGLVICPAIGADANMSTRVLVNFARDAAAAGVDVFRFDYRGCGESEGEFEETTVDSWLEDIDGAVAFLRSQAHLQTVGLLGLRLGGTMAALAVSRRLVAVDWLCLWEPILFPQAFVDDLLQMQLLSYNLWAPRPLEDRRRLLTLDDGVVELLGYCWRQDTIEALTRLDVLSGLRDVGVPSLIVKIAPGSSNSNTSQAYQALQKTLQDQGISSDCAEVHAEVFWQKSTRPDLDLAKLCRQDQLFSKTLHWMTSQAGVPSHA